MDFERVSLQLKAMAHPTRLRILDHLRRSGCCVQELERKLGLRQSNVSQHLRILRDQGLVTVSRIGHTVCYSLNLSLVASLLETLERQGDSALISLMPEQQGESS
jgi:ArsR family transcriptional regulator